MAKPSFNSATTTLVLVALSFFDSRLIAVTTSRGTLTFIIRATLGLRVLRSLSLKLLRSMTMITPPFTAKHLILRYTYHRSFRFVIDYHIHTSMPRILSTRVA